MSGIDAQIVKIFRDASRRILVFTPDLLNYWEDDEVALAHVTDDLRELWRTCAQKADKQKIYDACEFMVWEIARREEPLEELPAYPKVDTAPMISGEARGKEVNWSVIKPKRMQGYNKALYEVLNAACQAREKLPSPRDVIDKFKAEKPNDIDEVMDDGIKYSAGAGTKIADLNAIKKAISRMTIREK